MQSLKPVPVRPVYPTPPAGQHIQRAAWAAVTASLGGVGGRDPVATARHLYPGDEISPLVLQRAAVGGALTSVAGWASELAATATADFIGSLQPQSAMAQVIARGVVVPTGDFASVTVPSRTSVSACGWVGEAQPIPAAQFPLGPLTLTPRKAGVLITSTRELLQVTGGQQVFTQLLREVFGATVDRLYLGSAAASSAGLAGLLNGVASTPTEASAVGNLQALAEAVGGTTGSGEVIYIASPGLAASLNVRTDHRATILASTAVPANQLVAIDPQAVIHGINPVADITSSEEAVLHLEDTAPLNIATGGVMATPTQSMFQTSQVAFRLLTDLSWVKRSATAVAWMQPTVWEA